MTLRVMSREEPTLQQGMVRNSHIREGIHAEYGKAERGPTPAPNRAQTQGNEADDEETDEDEVRSFIYTIINTNDA